MKALVVDDSKLARVKLGKLLEARGIEVDTAESGEEAIERARRSPPNVIFMDHQMPSMDGIEAMKLIKNDPRTRNVPIIMCTGQDEAAFRDMAEANGAVGVLTKPPVLEELDRLLSEAVVPAGAAEAAGDTVEIHEVLERIGRIERRVPDAEHIDRRMEEISKQLHTMLQQMEKDLEERLESIVEGLSAPAPDAAAIAEQAARQAGEQVARRIGQIEGRIREMETALEVLAGEQREPVDVEKLAKQAAERIESGLAQRLEPIERRVAELDANLAAELETVVQRTVAQIPTPPAVLSDTELERVRAVAEAAGMEAARQTMEEHEPPPAQAISAELEESLRALSEEIARDTARSTSQSEARRVVEAHLENIREPEADSAALKAIEDELHALRSQTASLQKQTRLAIAVAGAAVVLAAVSPFVL